MATVAQTADVLIPPSDVHELVVRVLRGRGATADDSRMQADMLVEGDLRGQHSHGIRRLPVLAARLTNGVATSGVDPELVWTGDARLHVDGRRGLGPAVAHRALDALIPAAHEHGVAVASVANAGHIGMLAPYVERLVAEGCIGIVLTVSEALVAPFGGSRALVGTNPIGIGVPASPEPLVLDMSTAAVSAGKIRDYAARGWPIPAGWAVDARGEPTTDAAAAVRGAISAFGGAKGYALGLAFEALVGVLAGSAFGRDVHGTLDTELPPTKGDVFIAIPAPAQPALTAYLDLLRGEGADGARVLVPGDRARALRAQRLREGIPLDAALWQEVQALSSRRIG